MDNVKKIETGVDRVDCWALIQELDKTINKVIDRGEITPVEILGALDFVSKKYFEHHMMEG